MRLRYTESALNALKTAPVPVRKAFYKQVGFLLRNLHHPSLRAKKYDESEDRWQARVNRSWRFYFKIAGDTYIITDCYAAPEVTSLDRRNRLSHYFFPMR